MGGKSDLLTRTVLIIEDSPEDRATYKRYLAGASDYHYELVEAKLGAEGMALWRAQRPDCVLLDYRLPDSDGLSLLRAIVAEGGADACAIVMLTSMLHTQTAVEALKIGVHDYADKSGMSASMLLNAINNAIEKATLRRQLEEQRKRLSLAMQAGQAGGWEWNIQTGEMLWSEELRQLLGVGSDQPASVEAFFALVHPEDRERIQARMGLFLDGHLPLVEDFRFIRPDGTLRWMTVNAQVVQSEGQAYPTRLVGSVTDVTERKYVEQKLSISEERYRTLFTLMDQGFCVIEMLFDANNKPYDYRFLEINPVFGQLTGLVNAAGKTAKELLPDLEARWFEIYGKVALTGESARFTEGSEVMGRWFDVNAFRIGKPEEYKVAILFSNITERKQAERDLRDSEAQLRLGIQVANLALAEVDYITNTIKLSKEAAHVYGLGDAELIVSRQQVHATFHPDELEELTYSIAEALNPNGTGVFVREHRVVWPNGEVRWVNVRKQIFFDSTVTPPGPVYAILAVQDTTERNQTQHDLQISEERLSLAVKGAQIGTFSWNIKTGEIQWSSETQGSAGLSPDQFDNSFEGFIKFVHPSDRAMLQQKVSEAFISGEYECEFRMFKGDGSVRWVIGKGRVFFDDHGQPIRMAGVDIDITKRKVAEEQLQENQRFTQSVIDTAPSILYIFDVKTKSNTYLTAQAATALGYPYEMLIDSKSNFLQSYMHPEDMKRSEQHLLKVGQMPNVETLEFEYRMQHRSGTWRWFRSRDTVFKRDAQGQAEEILGVAYDITERKWAEQQLGIVNERFRIAENATYSFVYDWDVVTGLEERSEGFTKVLGYANAEFPHGGTAWEALIHPDDVASVRAATKITLAPDALTSHIEYRLRHKEGHWVWVFDEFVSMYDEHGNLCRVIGSIADITERKRRQLNAEFLLAIDADLLQLSSDDDLMLVVSEKVCKYLDVSRVFLAEIDELAETTTVTYSYSPMPDFVNMVGVHAVRNFQTQALRQEFSAGNMIVVNDVTTDPRWEAFAEHLRSIQIGSQILAPYVSGSRWQSLLIISRREACQWRTDEIELVHELARRIWTTLDRRHNEAALRESEVRWRELAEAMPQIVWTNDADGQVNYLNQRWFEYTGLTLQEGLSSTNTAIHPDDRTVAQAAWAQNLRDRTEFDYEMRLRRHDGVYRWHLARCVPKFDENGQLAGWHGTSTDIHERKQAELEAHFKAEMGLLINQANLQDLMWQTVNAIAQYFGTARAGFNEIMLASNMIVLHRDFCDGVPSIAGTYPLMSFGPAVIAELQVGKTITINDTQTDPRTAAHYPQFYRLLGLCAIVCVPLWREMQCVATLWIAESEPRVWSASEAALLTTIAERVWLAIESARIQKETKTLNMILESRVSERTLALRETQNQLRKLGAYAERLREEERTRIAREVHDELGGSLTGLKMTLARLPVAKDDNAGLAAQLRDMHSQIDGLVQSVRRIASDLRPPLLDDFGLLAAMEWQAQEWEKHTGIPCIVESQLDEVNLDTARRTAMFRVFRESLTNIARHAHATHVTATLQQEGDFIVLTVHDDGQGIAAEALLPGKSLGLMGMHERIRDVSGNLEITGAPDQGTTVTIRVPLA